MGKLIWILILLSIAAYKIGGVQGDCKLISSECSGGETRSATIKCELTTDNFWPTVNQQYCFRHLGIQDYVNGRLTYRFGSSIDLTVTMIALIHSDPFRNLRGLETYVKTITFEKGEFISVPTGLYELQNVNSIAIVESKLEKINLNMFAGMKNLQKLNASYNSIAVLEEQADLFIHASTMITIIDLSHNMIDSIPDNCFGRFTQLNHLNLSHNFLSNLNILSFEGLLQLHTLDVSYNKLSQIGHILGRFVYLEELSLAHNNLEAIIEPNFKTMTNLKKLNISENKLTHMEDAAFQTLSSLTELDLTNNHISVIRTSMFRNNSKLISLYLSQNNINTVEPGAFEGKNFTSFSFEHNNLTGSLQQASFEGVYTNTLDLSGGMITSLESEAFRYSHINCLNLSSNLINTVSQTSFRSLKNLTKLDISNNNISSFDFETKDLKDLVQLNIRNNSITQISKKAFQNLTLLEKLDLSFNDISGLQPQSFKDLEKLEILELNNNIFLNSLEANIFEGLKKLTNLQLAYTRIPFFENETFSKLNVLRNFNSSHGELTGMGFNTFKQTESLEMLDLSYNLLEDFSINTSSLPLLEELYLNNNRIRNVTSNTFLGLMHLITLDLKNNNIIKLGPMVICTLSNLQNLDISSNSHVEINSAIFDNLTSLTTVSLRSNRKQFSFENTSIATMKQLDLSSCQIENANKMFIFKIEKLENLNLSANKITFIDKFTFQNMPDLFLLDLSFNLISFIQPGSFLRTCNIQILNLHGNEIPSLQFGVLDGLKKLKELNLSSNALHSFDIRMLHKAPQISIISLDDNAIEDISFHTFSDTSIKVITIGGNPISCNAFVTLKKDFIKDINITAESLDYHSENVDGIRCKSDSKLNKTLVWPYINNTDINVTFAFIALKNAIENFGASINKLNTKDNDLTTAYNLTNILESIDKHVVNILESEDKQNIAINNKTQMIIYDDFLNKLSEVMEKFINNFTSSYKVSINVRNETDLVTGNSKCCLANDSKLIDSQLHEKLRVLNEEKEKIIVELKSMFQNLKHENNISYHYQARTEERNSKSNNNGVLYFIAVCLSLMIFVHILKFVYKFIKPRHRVLRSNVLHSSTQPIANVIEME